MDVLSSEMDELLGGINTLITSTLDYNSGQTIEINK